LLLSLFLAFVWNTMKAERAALLGLVGFLLAPRCRSESTLGTREGRGDTQGRELARCSLYARGKGKASFDKRSLSPLIFPFSSSSSTSTSTSTQKNRNKKTKNAHVASCTSAAFTRPSPSSRRSSTASPSRSPRTTSSPRTSRRCSSTSSGGSPRAPSGGWCW